mmetsp:Transcript_7815/g.22334  ORF Transcript_7815/g.22334 Transcript_7815/m.22334 type:complete len:217 (+) Transcript_7815:249-899(+)
MDLHLGWLPSGDDHEWGAGARSCRGSLETRAIFQVRRSQRRRRGQLFQGWHAGRRNDVEKSPTQVVAHVAGHRVVPPARGGDAVRERGELAVRHARAGVVRRRPRAESVSLGGVGGRARPATARVVRHDRAHLGEARRPGRLPLDLAGCRDSGAFALRPRGCGDTACRHKRRHHARAAQLFGQGALCAVARPHGLDCDLGPCDGPLLRCQDGCRRR